MGTDKQFLMNGNVLKPYRRVMLFMAIPLSVLLSMFALRFLNKASSGGKSYFGSAAVAIPQKEVDINNLPKSNLESAAEELAARRTRPRGDPSSPKLIHLSFAETASKLSETGIQGLNRLEHSPNEVLLNTRLPGLLQGGAQKIIKSMSPGTQNKLGSSLSFSPLNSREVHQGFPEAPASGLPAGTKLSTRVAGDGDFNGYSENQGQLQQRAGADVPTSLLVQAFILGDQQIRDGSSVRFRTASDFYFRSHLVARNTLFNGYAIFENQQVVFIVKRLGIGSGALKVNMHCRNEPDGGLPLHERNNTLKNGLADIKEAVVDEAANLTPLGSGVISRAGRSVFPVNRQRSATVADGQEIEFELEGI